MRAPGVARECRAGRGTLRGFSVTLASVMTKSSDSGNGAPEGADGGARRPGGDGPVDASGAKEGSGDMTQSGGDDGSGELEVEVELEAPEPTPEERIAELEAKNKETYDRYVRSVAELENVRKRNRKDMEDARADARARVLREMLPVVDNLERAVAHAESAGGDSGQDGGLLEGIRLVLRQFAQAFERCGVTPVAAEPGVPFDPNEQEAVSQAETSEVPPGSVASVLQTGYRIGDRLLRPALVVVAKAPAAAAQDGAGESAGPNGRDPDAP